MKTKTQKSEVRLAEVWEQKMKKANHRFAEIRTVNAIYDRVAIVADLPTMLTIQFPKNNSKNSKPIRGGNFTIKQENISRRDITQIRYYKD